VGVTRGFPCSKQTSEVNLYAHILFTQYGCDVGDGFLAIVHPDQARGRLVQVPDLREEILAIVDAERAAGRCLDFEQAGS
jgi:hypothetical protein